MVNVSAQSCSVTEVNPATLATTGGALVNGTVNVMFRCVCTGTVARWYDPSGNIIVTESHERYVDGSPYFIRNSGSDASLVIPTFNDSYDGTYNCGIRVTDTSFTSPSAAVTLTITSELMINTVSYLYVAT